MICGIGTDLIEIERIRAAHGRWGTRFLQRVFTPEEIRYALGRADPAPSLAARFAAKEAGAKALGTGVARGVSWKDIHVTRERGRAPKLNFTGGAVQWLGRHGAGVQAHLTLTHCVGLAQAVVILEK